MIEEPRGRIDYDESGAGATIVFVPGSCSTGAAWRPVIAALNGGFRFVTTSLLGYGGTAERRTMTDPAISHEAEIIGSVIKHAGGPVHLTGHSFGALIALATALRRKAPIASLTLFEAPAVEVLRAPGEEEHFRNFQRMMESYRTAFENGEDAAIGRMIDFYGGSGTFASWPERVRAYAMATTATNIIDWSSAYGFALSPYILASIDVPTRIVVGSQSHPAAKRANELLASHMKNASLTTIEGAAHFMIATHAPEVAHIIEQHISAIEPRVL